MMTRVANLSQTKASSQWPRALSIAHNRRTTRGPLICHSSPAALLCHLKVLNMCVITVVAIDQVNLICNSEMSRGKMRRMEAEAAERARQEREGVVMLRLKMADLFAKQDCISKKMDGPIDNVKGRQLLRYMLSFIYIYIICTIYMYIQCHVSHNNFSV